MKEPRSYYNWLTISGFILAVNSLFLILVFAGIMLLLGRSYSYFGVYIYIVLPFFLSLGLVFILIGLVKGMKRKETGPADEDLWPILNLNYRKQRSSLIKVSLALFIFLVASAIGSYRAFEYSNSVGFCGELCHKVMEPEYTTYLSSVHAQVPCGDCHMGEGSGWFVRSKLAALKLVYSQLFNRYSKPIPTPITDFRPVQQTCQQCHWPQKFYARKLIHQVSYLADSANTEWDISLIMKTGPKNSAMGLREGIHWHINPDYRLEYVSNTANRESIPWVRLTNLKTGKVKIFVDKDKLPDESILRQFETRTMDCMDCHNRPSHLFLYPGDYIDQALLTGKIPTRLPFIKAAALNVLKNEFSTLGMADSAIKQGVESYYRIQHPMTWLKEKALIAQSVGVIRKEYARNNFPFMKVTATSYLNNIGHRQSEGCFRCHSGRHRTSTGEVISGDCNLCHTIVEQGTPNRLDYTFLADSMEFRHPVDIGNQWKSRNCSGCHSKLWL
ncbi:MAG: NapC/NirT family cytochrome c [Bacteroidetes bacterium]|nr:NapC/NirT family cytochrome c [Bacteroidota bacterium]